MKRSFTFFVGLCMLSQLSFAQVYLDQFDDGDASFINGGSVHTISEANSELTITGTNVGEWDVFTYKMHDQSGEITVDATGNNKIFVRAKASSVGTQLRMDLQDADGFVTSQAGITKTLTTEYMVLEFDFTGGYFDGGFGGTACTSSPPCPVDGTKSDMLVFFIDPGVAGFNGTVVIDYIAFGEEPSGVIMSDVFQDHFDQDSSINSFEFIGPGYTVDVKSGESELVITGDGSIAPFDPLSYIFRNPTTLDTIDIDVTGNNKLYVKVKSSVPNTALRIDLQDIDGFVTTQGSITKIVGTDYSILEYDFSGTYFDLGFGGTPCTMNTAPCPVDGSRIGNMVIFIEPGMGQFLGELTIDYISFGVSLEPPGAEPELIYEDRFNNEMVEWTGDVPGFIVSETGSDWIISGDGTAGPFVPLSYILHDKSTGEEIFLDLSPAQNRVFVKAKTSNGILPLRVDLVDTAGYVTSQTSLTKVISDEFQVYEFDFTGGYFDGGFGGSPCMTGPCSVDMKAIRQLLIYPNPEVGGYDGEVFIDFISIGQAIGDDPVVVPSGVINYSDEMDDNTALFISDASGLVSTFGNDEWTITGNGTNDMWTPINYEIHNDLGEPILADVIGSGHKLYIKAKSSIAGTELRVDIQDHEDFVGNLNSLSVLLSEDYAVYELDYVNSYQDGAFGGSPCTVQPCPVDGNRIANLQFFALPGVGAFDGTITIDWVSFGQEIVGVTDLSRLQQLSAFPNPVIDRLNLSFETLQSGSIDIQLYNLVGAQVANQRLGIQSAGSYTQALDLSTLSKGIYLAVLAIDGIPTGSVKFVKY